MANTKTIQNVTDRVKHDIENSLQRAETVQDSLSQKMVRRLGKDHELTKQAVFVLKEIRKIQFRYFPVHNHSLLRYNDCGVKSDGSFERPIQKNNWRKYKREKEREKLVKLG